MKTKKGIFAALLSIIAIGAYAQIDSTGRPMHTDTGKYRTTVPTRTRVPSPATPSTPYPPVTPQTTPSTVPPPSYSPSVPPAPAPPPHGGMLTASIDPRQDTLHAKKHRNQPLDSLRTRDLPKYTPKKDTIR